MQSLTIIGRRCNFGRGTYFSAVALIDGKVAHVIDYQYGYDDAYVDATFDALESKGLLPGTRERSKNGSSEAPWRYCERMGIAFYYTATNVSRKKDL